MKGKSRRKKKTDWNAVAVQVLASVMSGLILKIIDKWFSRVQRGGESPLSCKYNIFFRVSKDEEVGYYCERSFGRLTRKKDL